MGWDVPPAADPEVSLLVSVPDWPAGGGRWTEEEKRRKEERQNEEEGSSKISSYLKNSFLPLCTPFFLSLWCHSYVPFGRRVCNGKHLNFLRFWGGHKVSDPKWSQRVLRPLLQDIGDGETSVFYFCWWRSDYPSCLTGSHIRHCKWNSSRIWHHTFNFIWAVEFHQIWHFWSKNLLLDLFIFNIENLISNNFHIFT